MKILRIFTAVILCACIAFTAINGKAAITDSRVQEKTEYKGILTIWHIDTFEGGIGSRKQFLLKAARAFEKQYDGVLVMVVNHSFTSYNEAIKTGELPDMVSFGLGVETKGLSELNIENNKSNGGSLVEKQYALPWCRGGYVLIANPKLSSDIPDVLESLIVSQSEYTQPLLAINEQGISVKKIEVLKPMDAYVKFVSGKCPFMLGTQRDVIRLENRGVEVVTRPLTKYNDLFQYIGITSQNQLKRYYSEEFIKALLSDSVQGKLCDIGMFSVFSKAEYSNIHMNEMATYSDFQTLSIFTLSRKLKEVQEISQRIALGEKEEQNKIKNMLV